MDTKSKNSRKFGILILILLLAASSAVMMLQYGTIRRQIECGAGGGLPIGRNGGGYGEYAGGRQLSSL